MGRKKVTDIRKFFDDRCSPEPNTGCWLWTGFVNGSTGYGQTKLSGRRILAHRLAYELYRGPIPNGLQLDHLCRMRGCVNPEHLEPVTLSENVRRGDVGLRNRMKTHCVHGHEYTAKNTYRVASGRRCRTCALARMKLAMQAKHMGTPNALKTHCPKGHLYDEANTIAMKSRYGKGIRRDCRECSRRRLREHKARQRGVA